MLAYCLVVLALTVGYVAMVYYADDEDRLVAAAVGFVVLLLLALAARLRDAVGGLSEKVGQLEDENARTFENGIDCVRYIRCLDHRAVPQLNHSEITGAECGACVAVSRTSVEDDELKRLRKWWKRVYEVQTGEPDWMTHPEMEDLRRRQGVRGWGERGDEAISRVERIWATYARSRINDLATRPSRAEVEALRLTHSAYCDSARQPLSRYCECGAAGWNEAIDDVLALYPQTHNTGEGP